MKNKFDRLNYWLVHNSSHYLAVCLLPRQTSLQCCQNVSRFRKYFAMKSMNAMLSEPSETMLETTKYNLVFEINSSADLVSHPTVSIKNVMNVCRIKKYDRIISQNNHRITKTMSVKLIRVNRRITSISNSQHQKGNGT